MSSQLSPSRWLPISNTLQRSLGDSEFAFFKNSSTGLGDMFLHLALRSTCDMMRRERVLVAWSTIRIMHPLLMSKICLDDGDLATSRFCFIPPTDAQDVLNDAEGALLFKNSSKEDLIFDYMNGPRTLSNDKLSYLVVSQQTPEEEEYHLLMCAPHFIGDGTSLHQSIHDFLILLASPKSDFVLLQDLRAHLQRAHSSWHNILPPTFESRLVAPSSHLTRAVCAVHVLQSQQREIGDHVFPRVQRGARRTRLVEHAFSELHTQAILRACKRNRVSVNNALFALCNIAWARTQQDVMNGKKLPMMVYSAINLRPYLAPMPFSAATYWFLALTYFTVILPAFPPVSPGVFWHRARQAKAQTSRAVKSPFLAARALEMAMQRAGNRKKAIMGTASPQPRQLPPHARASAPPAPSRALLGLSLIGNLDHIYTPASYNHPDVQLRTVTTASRQKEGGLLVLEHTFLGRLWLHLCWDEMGFEEGMIETWWEGVVNGVEEFMMQGE